MADGMLSRVFRAFMPRRSVGKREIKHTDSGNLNWSFRPIYLERISKRYDALCSAFMDPQLGFKFGSLAKLSRELPEQSQRDTKKYREELSSEAKVFLAKLDDLALKNPLMAVRIATILAASGSNHDRLYKEATSRICNGLQKDSLPVFLRLELGLTVFRLWPNEAERIEGLQRILLELLVSISANDAPFASRMARQIRSDSHANGGNVIYFMDDPVLLLALGRNLEKVDPDFAKSLYVQYLLTSQLPSNKFERPEAELRKAAEDLFNLENTFPSLDIMESHWIYWCLITRGFPDAAWYPDMLERYLDMAEVFSKPELSARRYRLVALNAPPQSETRLRALNGFVKVTTNYSTLTVLLKRDLEGFVRMVLKTKVIASVDPYNTERNRALPPVADHPIIELATDAYLGLVQYMLARRMPALLPLLVSGVEEDNTEYVISASIDWMIGCFVDMTMLEPEEAQGALLSLAQNAWYSGLYGSRKERCLRLFDRLLPELEALSPGHAAAPAKLRHHNPASGR